MLSIILEPSIGKDAVRPERVVAWLGGRGGAPLLGAVTSSDETGRDERWDEMRLVLLRGLGS